MIWECRPARDTSITTLSRLTLLGFFTSYFYRHLSKYQFMARLWVRRLRWTCTTTTTHWPSPRTTSMSWSMLPSSSKSALGLSNMWMSSLFTTFWEKPKEGFVFGLFVEEMIWIKLKEAKLIYVYFLVESSHVYNKCSYGNVDRLGVDGYIINSRWFHRKLCLETKNWKTMTFLGTNGTREHT